MGCCCCKKVIQEDKEIYNFFHNMSTSNKFNFTILNYQTNFDLIKNKSGNNFKKLEKKQNIRLKFFKELSKNINKHLSNEREFTHKSLFFLLLMKILFDENFYQDLNEFCLSISYSIFHYNYKDSNNFKVILYYLVKLFVSILNYSSIHNYIDLNKCINSLSNIKSYEIGEEYELIKEYLICFGMYYEKEKNIKQIYNIEKIMLELYIKIYLMIKDYIINDNEKIKFLLKNKYDNCSLLKTYNSQFEMREIRTINTINTINFFNSTTKNNESNKNFNDLIAISNSFYNYLNYIIKDISIGQKLFNDIEHEFNLKTNNSIKFIEIIFLIIIINSTININKIIIPTLLKFLINKFEENIFFKNLTIEYFIFMIENNLVNEYFIDYLTNISIKEINNNSFEKVIKKLDNKSLIHLLIHISSVFKKSDLDIKQKIYDKIQLIYLSKNNINKNKNNIKKNMNKEFFINILDNFNIFKNQNINDNYIHNLNNFNEQNIYDNKIILSYFTFYKIFLKYNDENFNLKQIFENDNKIRINIIGNIINYIYCYIILSDKYNYNEEIFSYIDFMFNFIYNNCLNYFEDSYHIYKILMFEYKKISVKNNFYFTWFFYNIMYLILILLKLIYKIPANIEQNNKNVLEYIKKININFYNLFSNEQKLNAIFNSENNNCFLIIKNFAELFNNIYFNYFNSNLIDNTLENIKKINDFIYNEFFSKLCSINVFYESQIKNILLTERNENINDILKKNTNQTLITEGNLNLDYLRDNLNDISIDLNNDDSSKNRTKKYAKEANSTAREIIEMVNLNNSNNINSNLYLNGNNDYNSDIYIDEDVNDENIMIDFKL